MPMRVMVRNPHPQTRVIAQHHHLQDALNLGNYSILQRRLCHGKNFVDKFLILHIKQNKHSIGIFSVRHIMNLTLQGPHHFLSAALEKIYRLEIQRQGHLLMAIYIA